MSDEFIHPLRLVKYPDGTLVWKDDAPSSLAPAQCSAPGTATPERESLEPWILEAARELAMDSAHIPAIAGIIKRHAPKPNVELSEPPMKASENQKPEARTERRNGGSLQ